jgi:hypothetical protein
MYNYKKYYQTHTLTVQEGYRVSWFDAPIKIPNQRQLGLTSLKTGCFNRKPSFPRDLLNDYSIPKSFMRKVWLRFRSAKDIRWLSEVEASYNSFRIAILVSQSKTVCLLQN